MFVPCQQSVSSVDVYFVWDFAICGITCLAIMTHDGAECCHTSLFELGISAACHRVFTKMTYMMFDLWTYNAEDDAHLQQEGSDMKVLGREKVQLTKWGDLGISSGTCVLTHNCS